MALTRKSNALGFTMMELMIVLVIMGIMIAIVAPISMNVIERSEAKVELRQVRNWLKQLSNQALLASSSLSLELYGNSAKLDDGKETEVRTFRYVSFAKQTITINQFGITSPIKIEANYKGEELLLKVGE